MEATSHRAPRAREGLLFRQGTHMNSASMKGRLAQLEQHLDELERLLADPQVASDYARVRDYARERAGIAELVETYRKSRSLDQQLADTRTMLDGEADEEMRALVRGEVDQLEAQRNELYSKLRLLLVPRDPNDERDVIVEIRAGTGGDEAALFAADLYRMYVRYAEAHGWKTELLSSSITGIGGFKEIILGVKGEGAYSRLKHESGVHRVQRVPVTEASGRIHTSTATVVVLPQVDEVEVEIKPEDLQIDVFRASGHGGQGVYTTDSAVRITHLPSGLAAQCQDERSQLQNKMRALSILRARLYEMEQSKAHSELDAARRSQVGSAERSEKVRTYNFPQNRVTDHRINVSSYRIEAVMAGDLDEFIEQLMAAEQAERLRAAGVG
jgi:peptide chain release factor 1